MRLTKKAAALLVAATMVVSMGATPVLATNVNTGTEANKDSGFPTTTLNYTVSDSYTWTVPKEITFTNNDKTGAPQDLTVSGDDIKLSVTKNVIGAGKSLKVTVSGNGSDSAFTIASGNTVLNYKIAIADSASDNYTDLPNTKIVLTVPSGTKAKDKYLKYTLNTNAGSNTSEVAGTYTGTATFKAEIVDTSTLS